jgi:hypothetical protein
MNLSAPHATKELQVQNTARKILLICGILSSLLYVTADVLAAMKWEGYSYINQAVSELSAIGAPTRPLIVALFSIYNVLVIAFAIGVWPSVGKKRFLRIAAIMLVIYAVIGEVTLLFSPMNLRGSAMAANDVGHITLTAVEVLSIVLFMAFGSGADGKWFRVYSIATIVTLMVAGILTGMLSTQMTAEAASTPWAGVAERVNIYGTMLWILVLALTLLNIGKESTSISSSEG